MNTTLYAHLNDLNDLLIRERTAITHLQMDTLGRLQEEKIKLMHKLQDQQESVDDRAKDMIQSIQNNNERNRRLLKTGLTIVAGLQQNVFRKLALTYGAGGRSLHIDQSPRVLARSV